MVKSKWEGNKKRDIFEKAFAKISAKRTDNCALKSFAVVTDLIATKDFKKVDKLYKIAIALKSIQHVIKKNKAF